MIFSSVQYMVFFLIIILLMMVIKSKDIKKAILLLSSYIFYAFWDYRFLFLMFALSLFNYYVGRKIQYETNIKIKKRWLAAGIIFDLSVLGFFKYFNFFIGSLNVFLEKLNAGLPFLNIILPVAISFIVFEVISYIIDIYRGDNESARSFYDLAILVAFFPHLIAGPILKPSHFLPQLDKDIIIKWKNVEIGVQIFLFGLVKKIIIADRLAFFVDPVFKTPQMYDSITIWMAVIAYGIQIFCDFSGYSDMAIGSAKCLGFNIPPNFNMPYISTSITEFWRRWHISLSSWLRNYLYIPLGGNRKGNMRQYTNLFTVMLLGGLWHGASWNFVIWGGIHGTGLAVHKLYSNVTSGFKFNNHPAFLAFCWLLTFIFVSFAWVFFRAKDFATSSIILQKMFFIMPAGISWYAYSLIASLIFFVIAHIIGKKLNSYAYLPLNTFKGLTVFFFVVFGLLFLKPVASSPFIYFQF